MKIFEKQTALVETFLNEFCGVNELKEVDLKEHVQIVSCPSDNTLLVVNADDERDIKFGVRSNISISEANFLVNFEVFGEYLSHKEDYPQTTKLLDYGGTTRDIEASSGE